jgi:hypothetical protein
MAEQRSTRHARDNRNENNHGRTYRAGRRRFGTSGALLGHGGLRHRNFQPTQPRGAMCGTHRGSRRRPPARLAKKVSCRLVCQGRRAEERPPEGLGGLLSRREARAARVGSRCAAPRHDVRARSSSLLLTAPHCSSQLLTAPRRRGGQPPRRPWNIAAGRTRS